MPITRTDRNQTFDPAGNLISEQVVVIDITAEANEYGLTAKVRQAVADNITAIGQIPAGIAQVQGVIDGTAANLAQANTMLDTLATVTKKLLQDYERMLKQLVALERLLVKSDLLLDDTGT